MHGPAAIAARRHAPASDDLRAIRNACLDCAHACLRCADECLASDNVQALSRCMQLSLGCADLCFAVAALPSPRDTAERAATIRRLSECERACDLAAVECWKQAGRQAACDWCAEACERCRDACQAVVLTPVA